MCGFTPENGQESKKPMWLPTTLYWAVQGLLEVMLALDGMGKSLKKMEEKGGRGEGEAWAENSSVSNFTSYLPKYHKAPSSFLN